jgi:adenylate cyclase
LKASSTYSPQTRRKLHRGVLALTSLIALAIGLLEYRGTLQWLENRSSDVRAKRTVDPPGDRDIVIIDIDNASYSSLTAKLGRWPWTRRVWTELVRYLTPATPKLILFDILFSGSEPDVDSDFAAVVHKAGNVLLPFAFVSGKLETEENVFTPPAKAAVTLEGRSRGSALTHTDWSLDMPARILQDASAASGSNLAFADPDGITRRLPLVVHYDGRDWSTVWLAAAMRLREFQPHGKYDRDTFIAGPVRLPVDRDGKYVVRWHGDTLTSYRRVPLWEMICSIYPSQCDASVPHHPAAEFQGKIVLVGASAAGSYEVRPTAVSETAPGMFVLATAIDNLLHNQAVRRTPWQASLLLLLLLCGLPAWAVVTFRSITTPLAITIGLMLLYTGICFFAYGQNWWVPMSAPLLAAAVSFTGNTSYRYITVDRELSRTRGTLERYVSPQLVSYVMDHIGEFNFKGEKKKLTVLFSDVRSFTTLTEKSDPAELLTQLNEYLEAMTDIIFRYDGIVDKFIGDGIMAHWGAFTPERPNASLAAKAALDMFKRLRELNQHWAATGRPPLDIGVGINTDFVIFGNVGTGKKVDFTAIGDGVNLASRLESSNKEFKTHIIISASTLHELGEKAKVRPLGSIVVKGKTVGVEIFELLGLDD